MVILYSGKKIKHEFTDYKSYRHRSQAETSNENEQQEENWFLKKYKNVTRTVIKQMQKSRRFKQSLNRI